MAFDSTVTTAIVKELSQQLTGGRISKIYQPGPFELALLVYAGGKNYRLLLSADARFARVHLTSTEKKNPPQPPMFCMLMRKYIDGGRILAVQQPGRERICRIRISVTDELGEPAQFSLIAEVMGKHSNIVLVGPGGRIVDSARRVTEEVNRYREVLPGLAYVAPPPTGKADPGTLADGDLAAWLAADPAAPAWEVLLNHVDALGPMMAKEAVERAGFAVSAAAGAVDAAMLAESVRALAAPDGYAPVLLVDPAGRLKDFHALPMRHWAGSSLGGYASVNACADAFYQRKEQEDRVSALRGSLGKLVRDEAGRVRRKLNLQRESLQTAENAEEFRIKGELITANLWQIKKGDPAATVVNYYDPEGGSVTVDLDPAKSPSENAQAYYHRYQKARSGLAAIQEQIALSAGELQYLEQVEASLQEAVSLPDLEEVRRELQAEGYLSSGGARERRGGPRGRAGAGARPGGAGTAGGGPRGRAGAGARPGGAGTAGGGQGGREEKPAPPLTVQSTDGLEIWIGRNNRQNDYLTLRLAAPNDLWFHTKEIPGSHVILRVPAGKEVPERAVHEAAALAAWHSRGRESAGVAVDYTPRKHVRKPAGARPGMVIYDHQKTLWVTPDPDLNPILKRHAGGDAGGAGAAGDAGQE